MHLQGESSGCTGNPKAALLASSQWCPPCTPSLGCWVPGPAQSWKEIQKNYLVPNRRKKWQAAAAGDVNACSPWKHMAGSLLWPSLFRRILSPFWALKQYPCLFCLEEYFL